MALCDSSVLTGQEGSIEFKPPGTSVCVRDFSAFGTDGTTSHITLSCGADFRVGDVVQLTAEDGANLDSSFTEGTDYYVVTVGEDVNGDPFIELSAAAAGTAITVTGDGGTGSADSPLPAHINIALADYFAVCGVRSFSVDISRDELDVTTLPCYDGSSTDVCSQLAAFRSTQAGFASATGSMEVYFTCDQTTIANRLLGSSVLRSQAGARVKLYVCTVTSNGEVDDSQSLFVEADISISGLSFAVNPDDATTATLNFSVKQMVSVFGITA